MACKEDLKQTRITLDERTWERDQAWKEIERLKAALKEAQRTA